MEGTTVTPEERAVIDAAREIYELGLPIAQSNEDALMAAVAALNAAPHDFIAAVRAISPRAANSLIRERLTAEKLAALEWPRVVDIRYAGPSTWAAWAIALEEAKIPAAWIAQLDKYEVFTDARVRVQEGRKR